MLDQLMLAKRYFAALHGPRQTKIQYIIGFLGDIEAVQEYVQFVRKQNACCWKVDENVSYQALHGMTY
jgi:hypothetical protein